MSNKNGESLGPWQVQRPATDETTAEYNEVAVIEALLIASAMFDYAQSCIDNGNKALEVWAPVKDLARQLKKVLAEMPESGITEVSDDQVAARRRS